MKKLVLLPSLLLKTDCIALIKTLSILVLFLFFSACHKKEKQNSYNSYLPKKVKAIDYIISKDSISSPTRIIVDKNKVKKILAGNPTVIQTNTNIHIAREPIIIKAGVPRIIELGSDTFLLPKTIPAIDSPFIAKIPEVEIVKEAYTKDSNAQNFSFFNKFHKLSLDVKSILEDKNGNMWFGTSDGVSKYDGKYFSQFTKKNGLPSNYVFSIIEDKSGNIWFGTDAGISRYDGNYFTWFTEKEGMSNNLVYTIMEDKSGNIWIGTMGGGISKYDGESFTHYSVKEGLPHNYVFSILEDKLGNIWIGTYNGLCKYDGKSFTLFTEKEGLLNNSILCITEDRKGNLWVGTDGGVCMYDGKSFALFTEKEGLSNNRIWDIMEDKNGNIWFGTNGGACKYDKKHFTWFTEKEGLSNNRVRNIKEDKSGNMWFGTDDGGVCIFKGESLTHFTEKEGLSNSYINSIIKDKDGNLWFGTDGGGVSRYDGKSFSHFTEKEGLSNNIVYSIIEDKRGNLWFGTYDGVCIYDGKSFSRFTEIEDLSNNNVRSILEDKNGNFWFGTYGGVSKYDGKSFTRFTEKEGLSNHSFFSIIEDKNGNLWFGTNGNGVSKYDGKSFTRYTEKEGLSNNYVNTIIEDKNGNLWFGTYGGGVSMYDGESFTYFTEKEGLLSNYIYSILEDKNGNIWFGTKYGLCKLSENKKLNTVFNKSNEYRPIIFKNFTYEDGFLGIGCRQNAICEDKTGVIWIGADDRLTAYNPMGDVPDTIPPNIQVTGIELFSSNIAWAYLEQKKENDIILESGVKINNFEFDSISRWYDLPENLSLPYNNNYLTFNFIGITQKQSKKVEYRYKLDGIDNNWNALTELNEATYNNLPHGKYSFKIKAVNSEGFWSNEYSYSFTIRPPFWKTWWFYTLEVLLAISLIFLFVKIRERKLRKDNVKLETIVKERTQEVVQQKEEIETQKEEIQSIADNLIVANQEVTSKKEEIEEVHKHITDSIEYASRIQQAVLPPKELINKLLPEHFILFKPRDVVSGDFYWLKQIGNYTVYAAADCTGHGVPGAFMSMLGISFLNEIVTKTRFDNAGEILNRLRKKVKTSLRQTGKDHESKDGMDIAVCVIDSESLMLEYSGAYNPLYIIRNGDFKEIKATRNPIGIYLKEKPFENHKFQLKKGDVIYTFSDGYVDQFGGEDDSKFKTKNFKKLLVEIYNKPMKEQEKILEGVLLKWQGETEQTDDIVVFGVRI